MELTQTEQEITSGYAQEICETSDIETQELIQETPVLQLQPEIDTLLNLADLISTRIAIAKNLKLDTSKLVNARGWTLELAKALGCTDDYEFKMEKLPRQMITAVIAGEIGILHEMVQFIEQTAPSFQASIDQYNQPFIDKIKALRELGEKTKDDQQEAYSQMIVLIYPYFQMICQNLMETKFQYELRS